MCAATTAVTNGLINVYCVYTTFMYTWPLACNMANTSEDDEVKWNGKIYFCQRCYRGRIHPDARCIYCALKGREE